MQRTHIRVTSIPPIIFPDIFERYGLKISVIKKVLGFSKAISDAVAEIPKKLKKLYVCYIHDNSNVQKIIDKIKNVLGITNIETVPIEPVFGVHVGIAAVGIASLAQY